MNENQNSAMLARSVVEETESLIRLHKGQVHPGGILPQKGGDQHRTVRIGASSAVHGSVVGSTVLIEPGENIPLGGGVIAPGTEVQGSINSLDSVEIGNGVWVQGGVMGLGDVNVAGEDLNDGAPGHVLIEGGISGRDVTIGDGVVVLGPVIATGTCTIGKNVTIRDTVVANSLSMGDGSLVGGLHIRKELTLGEFITIAAAQIAIPNNPEKIEIPYPVRSPFPGCNNCPKLEFFEGMSQIPRQLACHFHARRLVDDIVAGECKDWTPFDFKSVDNNIISGNYTIVSNIPKEAVNFSLFGAQATIWERGGEQ